MSRDFEIDIDFDDAIRKLNAIDSEMQRGIKDGAHDVLNLWQAEARHDSPIDTGTLRKNIEQRLEMKTGLNADMWMTSNAYSNGFNYAYYQHEVRGRKYLNTSADRNMARFKLILENEIRKTIKRAGW